MSAEVDDLGRTDDRLTFPDEVVAGKIIAVLPDVPAADLMAPVEAMIQEKVRVFALPVADAERRRAVLRIYRRRAVVGVHGVMTVEDVQGLVDDKVSFALPVAANREVLDALRQAGIPAAPDALTLTRYGLPGALVLTPSKLPRLTWARLATAISSPEWLPGLPSFRAVALAPMRCDAG